MMKKCALFCLCLFTMHLLDAKTLPLQTGRWVFDRYRDVELDTFDYPYLVQTMDTMQAMMQLQDGSVWQVVPMQDETRSFYTQINPMIEGTPASSIFLYWQPGDALIFHKVVNRDSLLVYNINRDLLLDMVPVSGPTAPLLQIASITNTNEISYTYTYNERTESMQQYQHNNWRTVIMLTDGSLWEGDPGRPLVNWIVGDPILMTKNTPWWSSNTHIMINCKATRDSSYSILSFRRLGVWRAG